MTSYAVASAFKRVLTLPRLAVGFLLILSVYLYRDHWTPSLPSQHIEEPAILTRPPAYSTQTTPQDHTEDASSSIPSQGCYDAPGADKVFVMLKTGATEIYGKLPTHFLTIFTCTPHFAIFSDLAQSFADYTVHDALAPISTAYKDHHADFEIYRKLQDLHAQGQDVSTLKGDGGWNLDKWKFLPMLFTAFEAAAEGIDWFVMIEADTSISWTNLLQWLARMDPSQPLYLGAQNVIGDTTFAHGGSGIILSRQAARQMLDLRAREVRKAFDARWEELTSVSCCGDEVIARTFLEANISLTPSWPIIQGERVSSIDFTDKHWCSPAITWHHVTPIEIDALWQFERSWVAEHGWKTPYLYRDVFEHFIARHVASNRTSWNNLSQDRKLVSPSLATSEDLDFYTLEDYQQSSVNSQHACAEACMEIDDGWCKQWMWSPGRCYLGRDIRFGRSDERESGDEHWTSGWVESRVEEWRARFEGCEVEWKGVGVREHE